MTWKGVDLPEGWTSSSQVTHEADRVVLTALTRNEKGEVLRDVRSTSKRLAETGASAQPAKPK